MNHEILQQGRLSYFFCFDGEMVVICKAAAAEVHRASLLEKS